MRSTSVFIAALAGLASTAFAADCAAQNIVDACVDGYQQRIRDCQAKSNDWICLCDVYRDVLTCYNNCPNSNERSPVENQVTSFCTAAEPLRASASSSMASVASVARTATTAAATSADATASETGASSTSASAPAFATGAASSLVTPAGAAVAALFAAAGLF